MRYNKQELFALASQTSQSFDREGVLVLKERQDSFFRRSEGCSVRWFRLRGNLLFYLKGPEPWYEPLGVIVLGNHQVSVQSQDENGHWPFQIVWENGFCYRMATFLECERTLWLKAMEAAPYEQIVRRIANLYHQLDETRTLIDLRRHRTINKIINDFNEVPLCELSLSCDNLLCDANGNPPSPFAAVFVLFPEKELCVRYCSTEVVERCSNPSFSRTVMFRGSDGITSDVLVRIVVFDVCEPFTQTGVAMGSVTMRLSHIQEAQRLRVPLVTVEERTVGFVTINGWTLEPSHAGASPTHAHTERNSIELTPKVLCHRRSQSLPPRLGLKLKYPSYGALLRHSFVNPHQATYRFQSGLGGDITVHEAIAEPRFCFTMPLQLVEIYMKREKALLETMLSFAEITKRVAPRQLDLVNMHLSVMKAFQAAKKAMLKYSTHFKPSAQKEELELGFVPINLHLQRMWVHNDTLNKTGFHDVVTAGAFSAHSLRADRPGGLIKLVQHSKEISSHRAEMMANSNQLEAELAKLLAMRSARDAVLADMDRALLLLQASKFQDTKVVLRDIKKNVKKILDLWNVEAVEEALSKIGWNKKRLDDEAQVMRLADKLAMQAQLAVAPVGAAGASSPEGAAGAVSALGSSTAPEGASALAGAWETDTFIASAATESAIEAVLFAPDGTSAVKSAMAVLTGLVDPGTPAEPFASSSSSSMETTPTAHLVNALSASVPDMQNNTGSELQFHSDYFKSEWDDNSLKSDRSERSDRSVNSGASGQSDRSGKSSRSGKGSAGNDGGERSERSWNHSFRSARGAAAAPSFERHGSLRSDFKSSASLEQVSYKSLVNNKKADKKKGKRSRRERDKTPPRAEIDPSVRRYNYQFFKDITTAIEEMFLNVVLSLNDMIDKGLYNDLEFDDTKIMMGLLIKLLDEAHKWTRMAHTAMRIDSETPVWTLEHATLQSRRDTCFSQALTTATAGLMCWLSSVPGEVVFKIIQSGLGPLCGFEGLLSLYALEKTMWGDMVVAIEDLHTVLFKLVKVSSSTPRDPQVTGDRNALVVELPVSEALYARFDKCQAQFTVTAVFFNVGINEKASVAAALGECRPQQHSNSDNLDRLHKYYHKYSKLFPSDLMEPLRGSSRSKPLEEVMETLRAAVLRRAPRNVEVLHLAALATRLMHGIRFTSCKSAKDRTGMAVTLEQATILSTEYHLADHDRKRALDIMRSEGCRRENTLKNIGVSKYAFSKKQVQSLPEEYRPPLGSYGTTLT